MKARILVVDEAPELRDRLCRVLAAEGHEVLEAEERAQALALAREDPLLLVVVGLSGEGLDVVGELRRAAPDTTVVAVADGTRPEMLGAAHRLGAWGCTNDASGVTDAVRRAADRARLLHDNQIVRDDLRRAVDDLDRLNARLADLANRDGLTGLYNSRSFREALDQELSRARRHGRAFSVILLDVDDFRDYDEACGRLAGDALLRTVARLLQEHGRGSTVIARWARDAFALLVPEVDGAGAQSYAETVRREIEEHAFAGREAQRRGRITISAGIATHPGTGSDGWGLIDAAERALEEAKVRGGNGVYLFEPVLRA
jgi:diguanylate cyclase (GGDEF)-like protein